MTEHAHAAALRLLEGMLEARTGQKLSPARRWRIDAALKPLARELGLPGIEPLVARIVSPREEGLLSRVVESLLNNESSFFRDPSMFDLLNTGGFDRMREKRRKTKSLRIWSVGCSTGQEAYSLAILLREDPNRWGGWQIEISGTDVSGAVVARAKAGRYSQFEIQRGLPVRTMLRWFSQDGDEWIADATLRSCVRFSQHNLLDPAPGRYDVILCRNVMMYFSTPVRTAAFERLADALDPDGILMLGAGETVIGQTQRFTADAELRGLYLKAALVAKETDRHAA